MSTAMFPSDRQDRLVEVLVAADDLFLRKLLRHQIEDLGCMVREAVSVSRALARAAATPPDLVVLDPSFDHGGGPALLDSLRRQEATRHVPVLVLAVEHWAGRVAGMGGATTVPFHQASAIGPFVEAAMARPHPAAAVQAAAMAEEV